jgi:hypothetical protein
MLITPPAEGYEKTNTIIAAKCSIFGKTTSVPIKKPVLQITHGYLTNATATSNLVR